jgi:plasmid stabilization system protein ParE
MKYRIRWTTEAYFDFSEFTHFIKDSFGQSSANDFISKIDTVVNLLSISPRLGKIIHTQKQIRAFVISKQITMVYRIKLDNILILNLFDSRQNPDMLKVNEAKTTYSITDIKSE